MTRRYRGVEATSTDVKFGAVEQDPAAVGGGLETVHVVAGAVGELEHDARSLIGVISDGLPSVLSAT